MSPLIGLQRLSCAWRMLAILVVAMLASAVAMPNSENAEEGCDSAYWQRVQNALAGLHWPPPASVVQRLAAEEQLLHPGDNAGCQKGRLVASVWRLVYSNATERAWQLRRHFGTAFYEMHWRPSSSWRVFGALAALQRKIRKDARWLYPTLDRCLGDGEAAATSEAEILRALHSDAAAQLQGPRGSAAAARFLLKADRSRTCPLAVATAFWTLAAAFPSGDGATTEVDDVLADGEQAAKSWMPEKLPFLNLMTTDWPLFQLLAPLEEKQADMLQPLARSHWKPGQDPRDPICRRNRMKDLSVGLEKQRVEVIVVYGRMDRVQILDRYLQRNLRVNGGVIDKVYFVVFAAFRKDLEYLHLLIQQNAPHYVYPTVEGRRLAKIYSVCKDPDVVYIKLDDDIVYIADEAIPQMVRERMRDRCGLVSANVVNHAILSPVHQDIGAIRNYFPHPDDQQNARMPWLRADDILPLMAIEKKSQSQCVWQKWECAAWMHESFLSRLADGTQCAYDFGWHDFHSHGHGDYRGDGQLVPFLHTRWSINMIAFKAEDLKDAVPEALAEDDEAELSVQVHARMSKRACAVGQALVAHFSYSKQEEGLMENTDLLERYERLSLDLPEISETS
eukprot:TRINITY_DN14368_c0_g1_i1.p1 TRINITY_DN14368_c0_g1~~TRINITY_DN14368_c0_g1_i1.p1  ORF type:complete len:619 (+),score=123.61 TRINITY_DN14368_c0_g1_i1:109-1965(+)